MKEQCKEQVYDHGIWHTYRCSRKAWKDGYCKQHHPDTVKIREEFRKEKWDKEWEANKEANRRVVAMQKACEGVDTDTLEKISVKELLGSDRP